MDRFKLEEFLAAHLTKNLYDEAIELLEKALDEAIENSERG